MTVAASHLRVAPCRPPSGEEGRLQRVVVLKRRRRADGFGSSPQTHCDGPAALWDRSRAESILHTEEICLPVSHAAKRRRRSPGTLLRSDDSAGDWNGLKRADPFPAAGAEGIIREPRGIGGGSNPDLRSDGAEIRLLFRADSCGNGEEERREGRPRLGSQQPGNGPMRSPGWMSHGLTLQHGGQPKPGEERGRVYTQVNAAALRRELL